MKDKRKKSIRKRETKRNNFSGYRAREIVAEPLVYNGDEFYEVHVVANLANYILTLFPHQADRLTKKRGISGYWNQYKQPDEYLVINSVENLVKKALSGQLDGSKLCDHTWVGCLF